MLAVLENVEPRSVTNIPSPSSRNAAYWNVRVGFFIPKDAVVCPRNECRNHSSVTYLSLPEHKDKPALIAAGESLDGSVRQPGWWNKQRWSQMNFRRIKQKVMVRNFRHRLKSLWEVVKEILRWALFDIHVMAVCLKYTCPLYEL